LHDANLHELAAHSVQGHAGLLSLCLDGHLFDVGLLCCYPDRLRVHGVCLVAQQEGFDVLGRQQLGLVTQ
jgi:hypothetical protein